MLRTRTLLTKRSKTLMSMGIEERVGEVKILIIGVTDGTGRILLEKALEQGYEVSALARNPSAVAPRDYHPRVLEGNRLDPDAVEAAVSGQDAPCYRLGHAQHEAHDPFIGQYCKQVRSCGERDDAEAAAWRGGATSVTSNISIEPL
jgi:putative NADH-flavin reductase